MQPPFVNHCPFPLSLCFYCSTKKIKSQTNVRIFIKIFEKKNKAHQSTLPVDQVGPRKWITITPQKKEFIGNLYIISYFKIWLKNMVFSPLMFFFKKFFLCIFLPFSVTEKYQFYIKKLLSIPHLCVIIRWFNIIYYLVFFYYI